MLRNKVEEIIRKNRIDAIYAKDGVFMNWKEVCEDFSFNFEEIGGKPTNKMRMAVYPGGAIGKEFVDRLSARGYYVECLIDNYEKTKEYKGVPVITYDEWLKENCSDIVLICSEHMGEGFVNQLMLDGYTGKILDVYGHLKKTYHNLELISHSDLYRLWDYKSINQVELAYINTSGREKEEILRAFIYILFKVRDFYYAEKYIEKLKPYDDYTIYKKAMDEIRSEIFQVVNKKIENVWFIHIIDSLANYIIEKMPSVKKIADEGIWVKGLTAHYPSTHYALNTIFTGKESFDIELGTDRLDWDDSGLLQYLKHKVMNVTYIAPALEEISTGESLNFNKIRCGETLSSIMFEGICSLEDAPSNQVIVLHSWMEIHHPFFSIGGGKKIISIGNEKASKDDIVSQSANGIFYVDKQIDWYFPYYNRTGCSNIIMGDHGRSEDTVFHFYYGIKKDFGIINNECISPALIITGMDKGEVVEGMISNTSLSDILLDWLKSGQEHKTFDLEKYFQEYVILETIPAYSVGNVNLFVTKGMYGHYEGFIGVKRKEEIYLMSASGRELYFQPQKYNYRNLANDDGYKDAKEKCKALLKGREYPVEIYALEKFKYHLEVLEKYDEVCFQNIMKKLELLESKKGL